MGLKYSKFSFLPYEEAVRRVKDEEIERIRLAFKRSSGSSAFLAKNTFLHDVLGDVVRKRLAEHIYMQCGGTNKGINFKDLVCALVLITMGHIEEKVKFLFGMISVDGANVTLEDLENFLSVCECEKIPKCVVDPFKKVEKLCYEEFYDWILENENFCDVSKWLLSEQRGRRGIKLSSFDDTPSFYQSLERITSFCQNDLMELEKRYWSLKGFSQSGKFDMHTLTCQVCPPLPKKFCEGLFQAFDKNGDGNIDFKELVLSIFTCCRGSTRERLSFCFKVFTCNKSDVLSEERLMEISSGLFEIWQSISNTELNTTPEEFVDEIFTDKATRQLSENEFLPWASNNRFMLEFLLLLSQICHIVFGLRPNTREEEGFIVRKWIEKEEKKGLIGSQMYYLIASSWWHAWKEHVNLKPAKQRSAESQRSTSSTSSTQSLWVDIEHRNSPPSTSHLSSSPTANFNSKRPLNTAMQVHVETNTDATANGKVPKLTATTTLGPIDNSSLLQPLDQNKQITNLTGEGGRLRAGLVHRRDYEIVPESVWRALYTWYGSSVPLPRTVIKLENREDEKFTMELYPVQLHFYRHSAPPRHAAFSFQSLGLSHFTFQSQSQAHSQSQLPSQPRRVHMYNGCFSRKNTLKQVQDYICSRLRIRPDDLRLWNFNEQQPILLDDEETTLEDYCIRDGHNILIEIRNRDMSWPEEMNSLVATKNFRERSNTGPLVKGSTGLHNLGNTCFMNSAIQCISNTYPLSLYFLKKIHLFELNRTNPLGLKGLLAKRYGELVHDLWNGVYRSIAPVKLRWTIGKYAPQFNGFQQHDSQELLSFLLDGLHEDLNRVHDKPYIELNDSAGRPDKEVAQEAWENHRKRNQSIIVDLFQGQLKSQVRCLACGHCSVRFDPYTFLSLPIPMENSLHLEICVFTMDGAAPVRYGLLLCNDATVGVLKKDLSSLSGIPVQQLIIVETFGPIISAFLPDTKKLRENVTGILHAYEVLEGVINLDVPKQPLSQRSSAPAIIDSSVVGNCENRLSEPAVLGGSQNSTNHLPVRVSKSTKRAPRSPLRTRLPFKRLEKRTNGIMPAANASVGNNGCEVTERKASSNDELASQYASILSPPNCIVAVMHRKMVQMDAYFLSWQKFHPTLFGTPILVSYTESTTRKEIYEEVWLQIKRFVSASASERRNQSEHRRYPFELKMVLRDGQFCSCCPWYRFCRGCKLRCDDAYFGFASSNLAIDWDPTTLHLSYEQGQEKAYQDHPSLEESMRLLREPINIDQCLKDFTKEEELGDDETWYCPECKDHQKIGKKISLWTLPPILIIHLKRFQLLNNRWIKSNKIVKFRMENFDPSIYLVEKDRRKRNPSERRTRKILTVKSSDEKLNESADKNVDEIVTDNKDEVKLDVDEIDDFFEDEYSELNEEDHNYRLYAISCHSGMLSGGHYITYARNPNGKWYKYNDSSCKEIESSVIEKESPYLLFFEKEGINISDYLPDVKNGTLDISCDDDEFESDVKRYCLLQ